MKKTIRIVMAALLALSLSLGFAAPAFADTDPATVHEAAITKVLKVPVGTAYPAMNFNFTVAAESFNDTTTPAALAVIPTIGTAGVVTIGFSGAAAATPAETFDGTVAGISSYYRESPNIFAGIAWPTAGKYVYSVVETSCSYSVPAGSVHEALSLSQAKYLLNVFVREYTAADQTAGTIPAGSSVGDRYIYAIGMVYVLDDDGNPIPGEPKGDPTPGGNGITTHYSDMAFTNKYVKTNGPTDPDDPDPTDPDDSTLTITKTVTGDLGSFVLPFNFSLTLTVPTLIPSYVLPAYKAYLVDSTGVIDPTGTVNAALIGTDAAGHKYINFAPTTAVAFKLTHGQKLVFINTPVGSSYLVSETGEPGYETSAAIIVDGVSSAIAHGAAGAGLAVTPARYVGETVNRADFLNNYPNTTPAGIVIENLPFYLMLLLAAAGLVVFVAIKGRKKDQETSER